MIYFIKYYHENQCIVYEHKYYSLSHFISDVFQSFRKDKHYMTKQKKDIFSYQY